MCLPLYSNSAMECSVCDHDHPRWIQNGLRSPSPVGGPDVLETLQSTSPEHTPFLKELRSGAHVVDPLGLAGVPGVLALLHQLLRETRSKDAFNLDGPTLVTAYSANDFLINRSYLLSNVASYTLLIVLVFCLRSQMGIDADFTASSAEY